MNRNRSLVRRIVALAGASIAGIGAAIAFASPASAHHAGITGTFSCDLRTGEYVVTWTVTNDFTAEATITEIIKRNAGADVPLDGITGGATVPAAVGDTVGSITGTQRVPGNSTSVGLLVQLSWPDGKTDKDQIFLTLSGDCVKGTSKPSASFETNCDSVTVVHLKNADDATLETTIVVLGKNGWQSEQVTLSPGKTASVTVPAAYSAHIEVSEVNADAPFATNDRTVPANCVTLPKTGAKITAVAGGAGLLLAVGAGLFAIAWRRRIRFTT